MVGADAARAKSEQEWLDDLAQLRLDAKQTFGDVAWVSEPTQRTVYAHKCIVYARATGNWQQRFMGLPHCLAPSAYGQSQSTTSLRTWTPQSQSHTLARRDSTATVASPVPSASPAPSDASHPSSTSSSIRPIVLESTDLDVFETSLEYFYTAGREAEAFAVVLEGFDEGGPPSDGELTGVAKLRQDLHFCWRSKLFADVDIVLEGSDGTLSTPFSAHRAILASRSAYFKSLLMGDYSDSRLERFTLPSPPFAPPSLVFVLGYMYTGTLDFSNRTFNLETVFETWRCAAFLSMSTLQNELEVKIEAMVTPQRAPRIYQFSHAPDVNSALLASRTLPLVVEHFDEMWATPYIGTLDYDPQMELVSKLRTLIDPLTVAKISRQARRLRKKVELERAAWAQNVESMLDAVEKRLISVIANRLPDIVVSPGFVDLVDGVGFSSDVLEWLLLQVFDKDELQEKNAPAAYQALVGSVLMREQGMMVDARIHVEDTRNGLLRFIKNRWASIRDAGGFDRLEPWCLKEVAEQLEVSRAELLAGERLNQNRKSPPKRLTEKPTSQLRTQSAMPNQPRPALPGIPRPQLLARPPRLPTASTVARTPVTTDARTSTTRPTATSSPVHSRTSTSRSTGPVAIARPPLASTTPRPPVRSTTNSQSSVPPSTAPSVRPRQRSASAAALASSSPKVATSPAPSPSVRAAIRPVTTRTPTTSTRTTTPRSTSTTSVASRTSRIQSTPSSNIRTRTTSSPAASTQVRKQASSTSLRSAASTNPTTSRSPSVNEAVGSSRSRAGSSTSNRRPSNASTKGTLPTSASKASLRQPVGTRSTPPVPSLASSPSGTIRAKPRLKSKPPGTSLLSGIPCIVTVKGTRPIRMRAMVRYLGSLVGETGQWVGVEIPEESIPPEARKLSWNDGKKADVEYFTLTVPTVTTSSAPSTLPSSPTPLSASSPRPDSLQPPAIARQPRRRSSSTEPTLPTGPTRGLFVRPSQIVYVL